MCLKVFKNFQKYKLIHQQEVKNLYNVFYQLYRVTNGDFTQLTFKQYFYMVIILECIEPPGEANAKIPCDN